MWNNGGVPPRFAGPHVVLTQGTGNKGGRCLVGLFPGGPLRLFPGGPPKNLGPALPKRPPGTDHESPTEQKKKPGLDPYGRWGPRPPKITCKPLHPGPSQSLNFPRGTPELLSPAPFPASSPAHRLAHLRPFFCAAGLIPPPLRGSPSPDHFPFSLSRFAKGGPLAGRGGTVSLFGQKTFLQDNPYSPHTGPVPSFSQLPVHTGIGGPCGRPSLGSFPALGPDQGRHGTVPPEKTETSFPRRPDQWFHGQRQGICFGSPIPRYEWGVQKHNLVTS